MRAAGLQITGVEGVYLKCLTTSQLRALSLPAEVKRAFFTEGVEYPDLCNAIYIEAVR